MLTLHSWFPTVIGVTQCPFIHEIQKKYKEYLNISDERPQEYQYYQLHKDEKFKRLYEWQQEQVDTFTNAHNYKPMKAGESWYIDYKPYTNNHWHNHLGWAISTIFYLEANPKDEPTRFRSPSYHSSNPLLLRTEKEGDTLNPIEINHAKHFNEFTYLTCNYKASSGRLLVFKSTVEHMTDNKIPHLGPRIIFSTNYNTIEGGHY